MTTCPFCDLIADGGGEWSNNNAVAFGDRFPVSVGHTLVVPRRHHGDLFALDAAVRAAVWALVDEVRDALAADGAPDGFNAGINVGEAACQTIDHAHVHVIPRYTSDVLDRAGVCAG